MLTTGIEKTSGKFILDHLMQNLCKTCGKDSAAAVQLYPSQAWEYYCKECYDKRKM